MTFFIVFSGFSQDKRFKGFKKRKAKYIRKKNSKGFVKADKQCIRLYKKKYDKPKKKLVIASKKKSKPLAEVDPNDTPPPPPKPKPKPQPVAQTIPQSKPDPFDDKPLEEKHEVADQVFANNDLPVPSSKKHEEVRKYVEMKLKDKEQTYPLVLDPLYFTFDESEFAVVDMEPFLIAVEYALQGRIILIEGHTDSYGNDDYNVNLSIQRVEKIRQLMHDMGVPDDRISVVGYGEELTKEGNQTEEGRQKNRRVDFTVF